MQIDKNLNLVFPCETAQGVVQVHAVPLSRAVFEANFRVIGRTYAAMVEEGLATVAGPKMAALMLREVATGLGLWDAPAGGTGPAQSLYEEMRRTTSVIVPVERAWQALPLPVALQQGRLSDEEAAEIEGIVCFFTLFSATLPRAIAPTFRAGLAGACHGQLVCSNSTDFARSLPTSTADGNSGAKAA